MVGGELERLKETFWDTKHDPVRFEKMLSGRKVSREYLHLLEAPYYHRFTELALVISTLDDEGAQKCSQWLLNATERAFKMLPARQLDRRLVNAFTWHHVVGGPNKGEWSSVNRLLIEGGYYGQRYYA